jgi:hypothetical protein
VVLATSLAWSALATAQPTQFARWSNESALTIPEGRVELALLGDSSWGVTERLELRTHPLASLLAPRVEGKLRWYDYGPWHVASEHSVWYPSLFLDLVARKGVGGLLPHDSEIPQALVLESELIGTLDVNARHWISVRVGGGVGPRSGDPVLLDFPFLYQRFSVLNTSGQLNAAVGLTGVLMARLDYELLSSYRWLNLSQVEGAYAWESAADLGYSLSSRWRISAGLRTALARFPIGQRFHWLPIVDLRFVP